MLIALAGLCIAAFVWGLPTYWGVQAKKAMASGRYDDAAAYYRRLERWQPRNADAILGQARAARNAGDSSRAKTLLSTAEARGAARSRIQLENDLLRIQSGGSAEMVDRLPAMLNRFPGLASADASEIVNHDIIALGRFLSVEQEH
ncbi:MAG: tetratricopeptide repeat protein, partial [Planctomycetaceae bacterium]